MKKIAVVFTSFGPLVNQFHQLLSETLDDCEIIRIADDSLIRDVMRLGEPDENLQQRTFLHLQSAVEAGAQLAVIACSSLGQVAQAAAAAFPIPVLRIDEAMVDRSLELGTRIGVLASLETTITPTVQYIWKKAQAVGKQITVEARVAQGAYQALNAGQPQLHDDLITQAARGIESRVDVILLAQGSMARLEGPLDQLVSVPVLASPRACALAVKQRLAALSGGAS